MFPGDWYADSPKVEESRHSLISFSGSASARLNVRLPQSILWAAVTTYLDETVNCLRASWMTAGYHESRRSSHPGSASTQELAGSGCRFWFPEFSQRRSFSYTETPDLTPVLTVIGRTPSRNRGGDRLQQPVTLLLPTAGHRWHYWPGGGPSRLCPLHIRTLGFDH